MAGWSKGNAGRSTDENPLAGNAPTSYGDLLGSEIEGRDFIEIIRGYTERYYYANYPNTDTIFGITYTANSYFGNNAWPALSAKDNLNIGNLTLLDLQSSMSSLALKYSYTAVADFWQDSIGSTSPTYIGEGPVSYTALRCALEEMRMGIETMSTLTPIIRTSLLGRLGTTVKTAEYSTSEANAINAIFTAPTTRFTGAVSLQMYNSLQYSIATAGATPYIIEEQKARLFINVSAAFSIYPRYEIKGTCPNRYLYKWTYGVEEYLPLLNTPSFIGYGTTDNMLSVAFNALWSYSASTQINATFSDDTPSYTTSSATEYTISFDSPFVEQSNNWLLLRYDFDADDIGMYDNAPAPWYMGAGGAPETAKNGYNYSVCQFTATKLICYKDDGIWSYG